MTYKLHDVSKSQYTETKIHVHPSFGEWKVFIPRDEAEFKAETRKIVEGFGNARLPIRIASVNSALKINDLDQYRVDAYSETDDWVEAYWQLYLRGYVQMGYSMESKYLKQLFAAPRNVLHPKNRNIQ